MGRPPATYRAAPLVVRGSRHLPPAQLLQVSAKPGKKVEEVSVEVCGLRRPWGASWGESLTMHPRSLAGSASIDIMLNASPEAPQSLFVLQDGEKRDIQPGDDLALLVYWGARLRSDALGSFGLLWTAFDRRQALPPLIVDSVEAERLMTPPAVGSLNIPHVFTGKSARVRRASVVEELRRRRQQKEKAMDLMAEVPTVRATELTVRGLRGFREDATLRLAQPNGQLGSGLTMVVGENNAGKSTLWESFDAVARKSKTDVSFSSGRRNLLTPDGVHIRLAREDGSTFLVESRDRNTSETTSRWEHVAPGTSPAFDLVSVPARRQFQASFGKGGMAGRDWMYQQGEFGRSRQGDQFSFFTGRLFELHNNQGKKRQFDDLMTEVVGQEIRWSIDLSDGQMGQSYYLKVSTGDGVDHTSEGLGDGIISLLFILNALYDSEESTLLTIDEPELSLHPQLVRRLGRIIARFAATRQIVVFTHSPTLISWDDFEAGGEVARVYKRGSDSRVAQASRAVLDEITRARGGWKNPHALGVDANSALFLDDGVIVVEGQEDAALLPRVFELLDIEFNGSVFGWGSGGATNIGRFLALLEDLGFARVAAILDNDVPDTAAKLRERFPTYLVVEHPAADIREKPAQNFKGKSGLMDERGKAVKPELIENATRVFGLVSDHLRTRAAN